MFDANEILRQVGGKGQRPGNSSSVSPQFDTIQSTPRFFWEEEVSSGSLDEFHLIDKRGLLFRPISITPALPRIPLTPPAAEPEENEERHFEYRETDALLPGVLSFMQFEAARPPELPYPGLAGVQYQHRATDSLIPGVPVGMQAATAYLPSLDLTPVRRRTRKRAMLLPAILALGVLLLYMFAPLVLTLIPLLPSSWSRVLIAFQLLLLAEVIIYRILFRTTRRNNRNKAERKVG